MHKALLIILLLAVTAATAAVLLLRPGQALRVATGIVSHTLCSDTFVAGLDPAQSFRETFASMPGIRRLIPWLRYEVDRPRKEVRAHIAGRFESRAAYHDGVGCEIVHPTPVNGAAPGPTAAIGGGAWPSGVAADIAGAAVVEPADDRLRAALDGAFAETAGGSPRGTKAVIVLHDGRIVAER